MTTLKLDQNNNLEIGSALIFLDGKEALRQDLDTRLNLFQGEYPFNIDDGVPYPELLQSNDRETIKEAILQEIKSDPRVDDVQILEFGLVNGKIKFSAKITTIDGEVLNA